MGELGGQQTGQEAFAHPARAHREPAEASTYTDTTLRCSQVEAGPPAVEMMDWTVKQTSKKPSDNDSLTFDWDDRDRTKKCISEEGDTVPGEWSEGEKGYGDIWPGRRRRHIAGKGTEKDWGRGRSLCWGGWSEDVLF